MKRQIIYDETEEPVCYAECLKVLAEAKKKKQSSHAYAVMVWMVAKLYPLKSLGQISKDVETWTMAQAYIDAQPSAKRHRRINREGV